MVRTLVPRAAHLYVVPPQEKGKEVNEIQNWLVAQKSDWGQNKSRLKIFFGIMGKEKNQNDNQLLHPISHSLTPAEHYVMLCPMELEDRRRADMKFEWDPNKEKINIGEHGITF